MYDEYDEPFYDPLEDDEDAGPRRKLSIALAVMTLAGFGWLAWYAYQEGTRVESLDDVPLIRAATEPYRERPDEAGGMFIPHRDKKVYETLSRKPANAPKTAERLLPEPEEPITPAQMEPPESLADSRQKILNPEPKLAKVEKIMGNTPKQAKETDKQATSLDSLLESMATIKPYDEEEAEAKPLIEPLIDANTQNNKPQKNNEETAPPRKPEPDSTTKPAEQKAAPANEDAKAEPSEPKTTAKPEAPKPQAEPDLTPEPKAPSSGYHVQLASFRSQEEASNAWNKATQKHTELLSTRQWVTQKADIAGKGTYYRLQIPMNSKADANTLCKKLTAQKQGCLVVKH